MYVEANDAKGVLRPRFTVVLPANSDETMERFRAALDEIDPGPSASAGNHAELRVPVEEYRVWSPYLSCQANDSAWGCEIHARFSPRPEIWTLVMFIYFFMVFLGLFGASFGYVQMMVDQTPWGFWGLPIGVVVILLLHGSSVVGQRLSSDQMERLKARFDAVIYRAFPGTPETSDI